MQRKSVKCVFFLALCYKYVNFFLIFETQRREKRAKQGSFWCKFNDKGKNSIAVPFRTEMNEINKVIKISETSHSKSSDLHFMYVKCFPFSLLYADSYHHQKLGVSSFSSCLLVVLPVGEEQEGGEVCPAIVLFQCTPVIRDCTAACPMPLV